MITFSLALVLLIVGYLVYGKYVDRLFRPLTDFSARMHHARLLP